jgi:phage gpG-like protein
MRSIRDLINDWKIAKGALKQLEQKTPRIFGSIAVGTAKDNFRLQGYDSGTGVSSWAPRSQTTNTRYDKRQGVKGSVYQSTNQILKQTSNLYNAIQYKVQGKLIFIGVNEDVIPYAKKMNEGGPGKWGKNATSTPARPYMPTDQPNAKMLKKVVKKLESEREKALRNFKRQ